MAESVLYGPASHLDDIPGSREHMVRILGIERKVRFKVASENDEAAHTLRQRRLDGLKGLEIVFLGQFVKGPSFLGRHFPGIVIRSLFVPRRQIASIVSFSWSTL